MWCSSWSLPPTLGSSQRPRGDLARETEYAVQRQRCRELDHLSGSTADRLREVGAALPAPALLLHATAAALDGEVQRQQPHRALGVCAGQGNIEMSNAFN